MYADDHQLYEINKNVSTVNHNLNANATKASAWYKSNLLRGNLSKYHTMLITNKQVGNEFGVRFQGTDVECLNSFKSLGATIDNTLNFSEHINITSKKASQGIGVPIKKFSAHGCKTTTFQGFNTSCLPYLLPSYFWHFCRASDKRKLERTQERGLRARSL